MIESTVKQAGQKVTIRTDGASLAELLQAIEQAIRGCGFVLKGRLDIVEEE